jgi:putative FmdB family regulatory protein
MPTYSYECEKCGNAEERREPITTPLGTTHPCPECELSGGARMVRVYRHAAHVIPNTRVGYPHYNPQLPIQPGQRLGEPNVMSAAHERDIMAGSLGGQQYEKNQI